MNGKDEMKQIEVWAEQAMPTINTATACVQLGCAVEEMAEMLSVLDGADSKAVHELNRVSERLKEKSPELLAKVHNLQFFSGDADKKVELADAMGDIIVTLVASSRQLGIDLPAVLGEINRSNFSKFEYGVPVYHANGKLRKGRFYTPPNLTEHIYNPMKGRTHG